MVGANKRFAAPRLSELTASPYIWSGCQPNPKEPHTNISDAVGRAIWQLTQVIYCCVESEHREKSRSVFCHNWILTAQTLRLGYLD